MASKTVPFFKKPAKSADEWVGGEAAPAKAAPAAAEGRTKRLTLDLPEALHRRFKLSCVQRETNMVDEIREYLEKRYPAEGIPKA